jgi:hypothetical protein
VLERLHLGRGRGKTHRDGGGVGEERCEYETIRKGQGKTMNVRISFIAETFSGSRLCSKSILIFFWRTLFVPPVYEVAYESLCVRHVKIKCTHNVSAEVQRQCLSGPTRSKPKNGKQWYSLFVLVVHNGRAHTCNIVEYICETVAANLITRNTRTWIQSNNPAFEAQILVYDGSDE